MLSPQNNSAWSALKVMALLCRLQYWTSACSPPRTWCACCSRCSPFCRTPSRRSEQGGPGRTSSTCRDHSPGSNSTRWQDGEPMVPILCYVLTVKMKAQMSRNVHFLLEIQHNKWVLQMLFFFLIIFFKCLKRYLKHIAWIQ